MCDTVASLDVRLYAAWQFALGDRGRVVRRGPVLFVIALWSIYLVASQVRVRAAI